MTTREKFERKLMGIREKYEAMVEELLNTVEELETEVSDLKDVQAELWERIEELEAEEVICLSCGCGV